MGHPISHTARNSLYQITFPHPTVADRNTVQHINTLDLLDQDIYLTAILCRDAGQLGHLPSSHNEPNYRRRQFATLGRSRKPLE